VAVDGSGNVYVADTGNSVIRKITPDGVVTTFAGSPLQVAFGDGIGSAARFASPVGVAVDGSGNVYVADAGPNNAIRKITPGGAVTTLAGGAHQPGSDRDGTGVAARFNDPYALTVDSMGNVYVAEGRDGWTIRKITPEGVVTTLAGNAGNRGFADGRGPAALFDGLSGIAVDGGGNIYVADSGGNGLIRKITQDGVVTTLAGSPGRRDMLDGMGSLAQFNSPSGLAIDLKGNLYVAEIQGTSIRKVTPSGEVTTFAGKRGIGVGGYRDGSGQVALFNRPRGLAVDDNGNVYVADSGNNVIRKISSNGAVTTLAGAGSAQP
jgi:sugar lactone lactonase YvrE